MSQNQSKPDTDLSLSNVGPDNSTPLSPGSTPGQGGQPDNDNDKPTAKQQRDAERAAVMWSVVGIGVCVLVAGVAAAIWAWGWMAVAVIAAVFVVIFVLSWRYWNSPKQRQRRQQRAERSTRTTTSRSGPGSLMSRFGRNRNRGGGMNRRDRKRNGGSSRDGKRRGVLGSSRSGGFLGRNRSGSGSSRFPSLGGTRRASGRSGSGSSRRSPFSSSASASRSGGTARRTPSPGRRRDTVMSSLSGSMLDSVRRGWREGYHGRMPTGHEVEDAVQGAVDKIRGKDTKDSPKPGSKPTTQGGTFMSSFRSLFEQITEELPQAAHRDEITAHDMGLEPLIQGFERGMPHIADYIKNARERIETENNAGTEGSVLEALETLEKAQRSNAVLASAALKVLRGSPTWQAMKERMESPNGAKSDVSTARQMGY